MADDIRFRIEEPGELHRLTFDPARDPAFAQMVVRHLGAPLPEPQRPSGTAPMLIWQGPRDTLIDGLGAGASALQRAIAGRAALLGDAGAGLAMFDLRGDGLDQRLGHDRPGNGLGSRVMKLAGLRVTALWTAGPPCHARLYVDRSHASYLSAWLIDRWRAGPESAA